MPSYGPGVALIVVDVQNDFADPAGSLAVAGGAAIVPRIQAQIERADEAGAEIVMTQDWHPPSTPHFAKDGGIWPVHCLADTWGAEIHPGLTPPARAIRIRKGANGEDGYSAFTMRDPVSGQTIPTPLESMLRERRVGDVVVCGLATDYCINATAQDARRLGFRTRVLMSAIAAVELNPGDDARAIDAMRDAGVELESATS